MTPYYQDESVTLYHGDCREVLIDHPAVDHVITDPPYEVEAHTLQRKLTAPGFVDIVAPLHFDPMSSHFRAYISGSFGVLVRRWALIFCQMEAAHLWRADCERAHMVYRRTCIWNKPDAMPQLTGDRPAMGYETFIAMHSRGASRWNGGGKSSVYTMRKGIEGRGNQHPTQKPEPLIASLIYDFTDVGESILDAFAGSGTTLVAAKALGRHAIGIEIEERYCEIAAKRLSQGVLPLELPRVAEQADLLS